MKLITISAFIFSMFFQSAFSKDIIAPNLPILLKYEWVIGLDYRGAESFNEGYAVVYVRHGNELIAKIINHQNQAVLDLSNSNLSISSGVNNSIVLVYDSSTQKHGFMNITTKTMMENQYTYASSFSDNVALVYTYQTASNKAFINPVGNVTIDPKIPTDSVLRSFSDDRAAFITKEDKVGFINKKGDIALKAVFPNNTSDFSEGFASFTTPEKIACIITKQGSPYCFYQEKIEYVGKFNEDLAPFKKGKKFGFIDKSMKIVIPEQFEEAKYFNEGFAPVKVGLKWGFINKKGQLVIQPAFNDLLPPSEGLAVARVGTFSGYIKLMRYSPK